MLIKIFNKSLEHKHYLIKGEVLIFPPNFLSEIIDVTQKEYNEISNDIDISFTIVNETLENKKKCINLKIVDVKKEKKIIKEEIKVEPKVEEPIIEKIEQKEESKTEEVKEESKTEEVKETNSLDDVFNMIDKKGRKK